MQGRLGLQQTPKPAGGAGAAPRVRGAPKSAPKRDGPLWRSVKVISDHATSPTLQCLNFGRHARDLLARDLPPYGARRARTPAAVARARARTVL